MLRSSLQGMGEIHCVKSARIRSTECALRIRSISPYSVRMWENTDQNNSEYVHFSHSDYPKETVKRLPFIYISAYKHISFILFR